MAKYVAEFTVPPDDRHGICGVKFEDGGEAAIMYYPLEDKPHEEGGDGHFFVRLHSYQDGARKGDAATHPLFRQFMGKKVRVTVEEIDETDEIQHA